MQNVHPMFVHFPIAFLLAVPLIDLIGLLRREEWYFKAGSLVLFLGVLGAVGAVTTGLVAEETVPHSSVAAHSIMELHERMAYTVLGLAVGILLVRSLVRRSRTNWKFLAVVAAEIILLASLVGYTGFLGGKLVHEHGVGTALTADEATGHEHDAGEGEHEH